MTRYLGRKLLIYLVTFWVAVTIDWAIRASCRATRSSACSRACRPARRARRPRGLLHRGVRLRRADLEAVPQLLGALFDGDLGNSIANFPTPVSELILTALPYTLALLIPAILLSFWAGNKVGALAARRKALDNTVLPASYVLTATPPDVARDHARLDLRLEASPSSRSPARTRSTSSRSGRSSSRGAPSSTGSCPSRRSSSSPSAAGRSGCGT